MHSTHLLAVKPQTAQAVVRSRGTGLVREQAVAIAVVLAGAGVFSIYSTANFLWALWTTDPLKSIGGLIPMVSLVLILRVWRSLGWELRGTWWGLALVAGTVAAVHLRDHAVMELILAPWWTLYVPPHSLVVFCYTAGIVLLFGGKRLFRAALFPIVLTWFVNPVPNIFNRLVDLPLQHASALVARGFAQALGQKLSPDQLRLMFTPEFGMFIAPGCNGMRGAITMGFLALIAGYLYRFRPVQWMLTVLGAVLLGYVFNFVRLCTLVLYYLAALHVRSLQPHAEMGDYLIGAALFFAAGALLFRLIRLCSATGTLRVPSLQDYPAQEEAPLRIAPHSFMPRWAALALLLGVGSVSYGRDMLHDGDVPRALSDSAARGQFPKQVGRYALQRSWNEYLPAGPLIFYWADYQAPGSTVVSVGVSPVLGAHDTLVCHSARGDDWLWHGDVAFATAAARTSFSTSLFADGTTQYVEATTVCSGESCGQYSTASKHFGFVYSRPDTHTLLTQSPSRPIPVLLRTEMLEEGLDSEAARSLLVGNLRSFLQSARLGEFTKPYRQP